MWSPRLLFCHQSAKVSYCLPSFIPLAQAICRNGSVQWRSVVVVVVVVVVVASVVVPVVVSVLMLVVGKRFKRKARQCRYFRQTPAKAGVSPIGVRWFICCASVTIEQLLVVAVVVVP